MPEFDPLPAARQLAAWRAASTTVTALPAAIAPRTPVEGAAVQWALAGLLHAQPPGGFKIGATAKVMQDYLGLSGPAAGFMPAPGLHPDGAVLRFADFRGPGVECEVAVRLAHDLPAGPCDQARAAAAVGEFFAAIEVVERRYGDLAELGAPSLIGDQVFHAAAVLGPPAPGWSGLALDRLAGRLTVDGTERGAGISDALLGHPFNSLAWLAGSAEAAAFGGLRAGQVVLLGSVTPPIWLDAPGHTVVAFEGLPPVSLTLA